VPANRPEELRAALACLAATVQEARSIISDLLRAN
jgi:hypothetical protein